MTTSTLTFTISAFVTFLTIIDPVGLAPVVVALTAHLSEAQRKLIITRATLISAGIIAFFAVVGRFLLDRLGINLYAFDIAGGAFNSPFWAHRYSGPLAYPRYSAGSACYAVYPEWDCFIFANT
jgi:hypothetical protein